MDVHNAVGESAQEFPLENAHEAGEDDEVGADALQFSNEAHFRIFIEFGAEFSRRDESGGKTVGPGEVQNARALNVADHLNDLHRPPGFSAIFCERIEVCSTAGAEDNQALFHFRRHGVGVTHRVPHAKEESGRFLIAREAAARHDRTMQILIAALIGLGGGIASGLFGVGGGIVMVPAMVFFLTMDIKMAVGTSLAVIIPTALSGAFKHYELGNINWRIALALVPTAVCGSYLGAWLTKEVSSANLKRAFGGFIIIVGIRLLLGK